MVIKNMATINNNKITLTPKEQADHITWRKAFKRPNSNLGRLLKKLIK